LKVPVADKSKIVGPPRAASDRRVYSIKIYDHCGSGRPRKMEA
jgi:hypothetical protein